MDTRKVNGDFPKENGSHRKPPTYSVETPYGFHLDLDFVKYVEDIEKGNTIRRVQLQRRPRGRSSGNLSRNLSLPGYGCRSAQWSSTSILFPRTRLADSQQLGAPQCSTAEVSAAFRRQSESLYRTSKAFDEQLLGPHVRPNLLRASSLPLTVLLRKYSTEDTSSPSGSRDFLSVENGSSEDVFHSSGVLNGTFQQLTAALRRVGELEEEIRMVPELKAQICVLQEERERLLHAFQSEPDNTVTSDFPRRVVKMVEKKHKANDDWMDREYNQLEENVKASSEQVDAVAITTGKISQATQRDHKDESLVEALQKKITMLEQKLHKLRSEVEKKTNLLMEQRQESRFKDERINELTERHAEHVWVRADKVRNTPDLKNKPEASEWSEVNRVGPEEELKPCVTSGPAGSQADVEHHVKKVRELLQEQWECLCRDEESGKQLSSEHLHPRVCSIQTQLVSLVNLLMLYISPAGETSASAQESMMEDQMSVLKSWESPEEDHGGERGSAKEVEDGVRPKDPAQEGFNTNLSQTEELPSSTLTTKKHELAGETTAESTRLKVAVGHEEQDSMCEAKCPEDQAVEEENERDGTCSGAEPEEASHGDRGRGVETDFMNACHFLEKHMDEVSEPNDEMRRALMVVFQRWFHVCAEENSSADTAAVYINRVATETPVVLQFLINMVDDNGNTALHYSASHSNFSIVKLLLDTGVCDVDLKNKNGYTAVMLASLQQVDPDTDIKAVQQLMELGDVNTRAGQVGQTALHLAVRHGRASTVRLLLAHGANVNAQDEAGTTALISACDRGHADIVHILLQDPDCDVNLTDKGSRSALSLATEASHTEIADLLKARTANIKAHDKCKMS